MIRILNVIINTDQNTITNKTLSRIPVTLHSIKYNIKVFIRHIANNTLGRLQRGERKRKPNIMVFSNRRGGSTWLIELLSSEPRTKRAVEIFDVTLNHNPYKNDLPKDKDGFFIDLNKQEKEQLFSYFSDIESGKKVYNTQWKFWKDPFNFSYNRIIFKIFYAKNYITDFSLYNNCQIVFQLRHPIPTALSILKQGWPSAAKGYISSTSFRKKLSNLQIYIADYVVEHGTELEVHVLGWFLENYVPMQAAKESDWLILTYEDMLMSPEKTMKILGEQLELSCTADALKNYDRPSYNALGSQNKIKSSTPEELCNGWQKKVNFNEHPNIQKIFNAFPNSFYELNE
ncbi:MAG: hypothetical protein ACJAS9_002332 [Polaribacter sp.]|jgi:hypothetical protein